MKPDTVAAIIARLTLWEVAHPERVKPMPAAVLAELLDVSPHVLGRVLPLLSWRRTPIWSRKDGKRVRRVWYAPAGQQVPRPQRGRPRFDLSDYLLTTLEGNHHGC